MMNPSENAGGHRQEMTSLFLLSNVKPMENHPFQVRDDEEMEALVESIRQFGVLNPIIVRFRKGDNRGYEIVSGHRRYEACNEIRQTFRRISLFYAASASHRDSPCCHCLYIGLRTTLVRLSPTVFSK